MPNRKPNILRSAWRFFEILLFFAVSVLGFGLLFKTSGFGSRSKEKVRQQHAATAVTYEGRLAALSRALAPLDLPLNHSSALHAPEGPAHAAAHPDAAAPACAPDRPATHTALALSAPLTDFRISLPLPANLLQENPVLLI